MSPCLLLCHRNGVIALAERCQITFPGKPHGIDGDHKDTLAVADLPYIKRYIYFQFSVFG